MSSDIERFINTINHKPHSDFLFYAGFTPNLSKNIMEKYGFATEEDIVKYFNMFAPVSIRPQQPEITADFSKYFLEVEKPEGSFINSLGVLEIPAKFYHFTGYISPLRNAKSFNDIKNFPFPYTGEFNTSDMKKKVKESHQTGKVSFTWIGHMYEDAWQIRGYEEFLQDIIERPQWVEYILDKLMERNIKIATCAAEAGIDYIATGDDVATQKSLIFSPSMWRRFIKTRWEKIYKEVRKIKPDIQIWYHSDGNITNIINELIDIGVTILNPLQPECMDLLELKKEYGKYLVFDGTIGTQSTMPFGKPEEVKRTIRERKKQIGYDGAFIISPTHILEPEVPIENIEAFFDACRENE
jgi:uroporphyrinogen decarboxylase